MGALKYEVLYCSNCCSLGKRRNYFKRKRSSKGGHFGVNRNLERIRKKYYSIGCKQEVEDWCSTCTICIIRKGPAGQGKSEMRI